MWPHRKTCSGAGVIGGGACGQLGSLEAHHESDGVWKGGMRFAGVFFQREERGGIGVHVTS